MGRYIRHESVGLSFLEKERTIDKKPFYINMKNKKRKNDIIIRLGLLTLTFG